MIIRSTVKLLVLAYVVAVLPQATAADTELKSTDLKPVVEKAYAFLKTKQSADGSLAAKFGGPGITALTTAALIRHGYDETDPVVEKALAYLQKSIKPDGGIYDRGLQTYTTSLAIIAFQEANKGGKYDKVIASASKFVKGLQFGEGVDPKDPKFGGTGYDGKSRPDLSNTQFMLDALLAAGVAKDDPAIKRSIAFISRSQNLPGEFNELPYAGKVSEDDKGGFVYNHMEADKKDNPKGTAAGGLRSEGGMTYAGLKSFLYAGVSKDDPRVKAAVSWVRKHYTLDENPGMGKNGLFYYYVTFSKAMSALGEDRFADEKGTKHDWRKELFETLKKGQKDDGSWANSNKAFLEDNQELATSFALLALSYAKP